MASRFQGIHVTRAEPSQVVSLFCIGNTARALKWINISLAWPLEAAKVVQINLPTQLLCCLQQEQQLARERGSCKGVQEGSQSPTHALYTNIFAILWCKVNVVCSSRSPQAGMHE